MVTCGSHPQDALSAALLKPFILCQLHLTCWSSLGSWFYTPSSKALSGPCSFTVHSDIPSRSWDRGLGEVLAVKVLTLLLSLLISSPFQSPLPYKNPSTVLGILKIKEGGRQK